MSTGGRSPLRLRGRALVAGAGSTAALVGAVAAVALVGAGLVAFDAWPRPAPADSMSALPLAPGTTTTATIAASTGAAAVSPATTSPAAVPASSGRSAGPGGTADRSSPGAPRDGAAPSVTPAPPGAGGAPPADPSPQATPAGMTDGLDDAGSQAGQAVADVTRETGRQIDAVVPGPPGTAVGTLTDESSDAVVQAAEIVAQALERLPG